MHITFVKKILANGELCKKCEEVTNRMQQEGITPFINHIVIADDRESDSPGTQLAQQYQISRAPFFIVEDNEKIIIFDIYFKLKKFMQEKGLIQVQSRSL